jgi:hypothetical protein
MAASCAFDFVAAHRIGVSDGCGIEAGDRRPVLVGVGSVLYGAGHQCRGDKHKEEPAKGRRDVTVLYDAIGSLTRHWDKKRKVAKRVKKTWYQAGSV